MLQGRSRWDLLTVLLDETTGLYLLLSLETLHYNLRCLPKAQLPGSEHAGALEAQGDTCATAFNKRSFKEVARGRHNHLSMFQWKQLV